MRFARMSNNSYSADSSFYGYNAFLNLTNVAVLYVSHDSEGRGFYVGAQLVGDGRTIKVSNHFQDREQAAAELERIAAS